MLRLLRQEDVVEWHSMPCAMHLSRKRVRTIAEGLLKYRYVQDVIMCAIVNQKIYILDGLHRISAFRLSNLSEVIADVRFHYFKTMESAVRTYVKFGTVVKMRKVAHYAKRLVN